MRLYTALLSASKRSLKNSIKNRYLLSSEMEGNAANVNIGIISNGFNGTSKSFLLKQNDKQYLFNAGEGVQRIQSENHMKIGQINDVFLTRKSWNCFGGIMCTMLSVSAQSDAFRKYTFHSPFSIYELLRLYKHIANFTKVAIEQFDYDKNKCFTDGVIKIEAIRLTNKQLEAGEPRAKRIFAVNTSPDSVFAYLINIKAAPPTLNIQKVVEFKVPDGPLRGLLKSGKDVTLDDGRVVLAKDCLLDYDVSDSNILVLDCPNESYIDQMVANTQFNQSDIGLILHLSDSTVLRNEKFKSWLASKSQVEHVILDETYPNVHSGVIYKQQNALNYLDEKIFPKLSLNLDIDKTKYFNQPNVNYGQTNMRLNIRPKTNMATNGLIKLESTNEIIENLREEYFLLSSENNFDQFIDDLKKKLKEKRDSISTGDAYPKFVFLGTGSSLPSATRNVSSILVQIDSDTNMLLDCGEDTLGQLIRFFGDNYEIELKKLKAMFLSHYHIDHISGFYNIINKRHEISRKTETEKLIVCLPDNMKDLIEALNNNFDSKFLKKFNLIYNKTLHPMQVIGDRRLKNIDMDLYVQNTSILKRALNLKAINTIPVEHVQKSCALAFETSHENSFKAVFSGDCRPCKKITEFCKDYTLLIHEATFDQAFLDHALLKKHSTINEAVEVGLEMNAKHIILWHFSQRYAKLPLLNNEKDSKFGISFDNMIVDRHDLELLPLFNDAYKLLFTKEHNQLTQKANKHIREATMTNIS